MNECIYVYVYDIYLHNETSNQIDLFVITHLNIKYLFNKWKHHLPLIITTPTPTNTTT